MSVPVTVVKAIAVQYQAEDGSWVTVGRCDVGSILRTRRLGFAPGVDVVARYWRIVREGDDVDLAGAVVSIGRVAFMRETGELSSFRRWSFDFDTGEQRYSFVATHGNVEVYRRGERVASIASPYVDYQIAAVQRAQSLDTMLTFHRDVAPNRFVRQGSHSEWDTRPQDFKNVPVFDYDGTRAGGVDEVQQLAFTDFVAGETFNLTLEDVTTTTIAYSASMADVAASVASALQALANVGPGGVTTAATGANTISITYVGANRSDDVGEMVARVVSSDKGIVRTATLTQGVAGGEPVMSQTRGWPAAGVFYEQRLCIGGFRSRPQTIIGSRSGFPFDLNTKGGQVDKGFDVELATDQATRILAMAASSRLQIFSQSAEFYCATQGITPPPILPRSSTEGMEPETPHFDLGGNTVFVQAGGDTISRYIYSDADQGYLVQPLSSYAPHLTRGIVAGGLRRYRSTTQPNLALWVRRDGKATAMTAVLDQDVLGFTGWDTDGAFVDAGAELAGDLYVGTRRDTNGVPSHRLEVLDDRHVLDGSVRLEGVHNQVTGLKHLEGRTCVAYIDGADAGDVEVFGGVAVLPYASVRSVEVGLLFVPRGRTLPGVLEQDPRGGASMHARTGEIALRLGPTANLFVGMTGKRLWPVNLKRRGGTGSEAALLDGGPGEDAFEGWTRLYPVPGFQDDAQIDWEQPRPGPLEIREVVATVHS